MSNNWMDYGNEILILNSKDMKSVDAQLSVGSRFTLNLDEDSEISKYRFSFVAKSRCLSSRGNGRIEEYCLTNDERRKFVKRLKKLIKDNNL